MDPLIQHPAYSIVTAYIFNAGKFTFNHFPVFYCLEKTGIVVYVNETLKGRQ